MLPSFRFLFAAIVFSMSILVFGLGAAALLRTAHEEFASNPFWHGAPEKTFPQRSEPKGPVLALLRAEPLPVPDDVPPVAAPVEPAAVPSVAAEPENIAALGQENSSQPESAPPETPVPEGPVQSETAPAQVEAVPGETKLATTEEASSSANEAAPTASGETSAPALPEAGIAVAKIAALDAPAVAIEAKPAPKAANARTISAEPDGRERHQEAPAGTARSTTPQDRGSRAPGATGSSAGGRPVRSTIRSARGGAEPLKVCDHAGPVATGGPSGRPHSAHEPS
jgi:hypothetical protein